MRRAGIVTTLCALLMSGCGAAQMTAGRQPADTRLAAEWEALLAAEDARISTSAHLDVLRSGLSSESAFLRATAVRAVGRSERADLLNVIAPLLRDPSDSVRAAAAHAIGNVSRREGVADARRLLLNALPAPGGDGVAAAAMAETLGRLASDAADAREAAVRLTPFLAQAGAARTGALRGLYFLARQPAARAAVSAVSAEALRRLASSAGREAEPDRARERTLAVATLALVRATDEPLIDAVLQDPSPLVRREAVAAAGTLSDTAAVRRIVAAGARDASGAVRYEALRVHAGRLAGTHGCAPVVEGTGDSDERVALLAIDLLGTACRSSAHAELLDSIAASVAGGAWHRAAHAAVAIAATDPERGRVRAGRLARHESPFARTYAARAAAISADTTLLYQLARDPHANVRTAAISGLDETVGAAADAVALTQLESDESELLMAVSAALEGSRQAGAADRLLDALDRVTALRKETSRDGRLALLERAGELGNAAHAPRLQRYLTDFDPLVAEKAAAVLEVWTGERHVAQPRPLPRLPLPTFTQAAQLARTAFVLEMADGSEIELHLLPFDAPTNAARFARLARTGYFNGLTLHRIVPNFVAQGGSPGANEYSGDGPFTRDELGEPNWRGTLGLSTRGRDTGDAQFYINLIDNVRLDHEYTVFGVVARGMDVVDRLQEGAVILRVREESRR